MDKSKSAAAIIDDNGPTAEPIGSIHAINAFMWFLAIDAKDAAEWKGGGADGNGPDFSHAMDVEEGEIAVGKSSGVLASLEDTSWSNIWRDGKTDLVLLMHYRRGDTKTPEATEAINRRVAQLPVRGKPVKLGELEVKSGCMALLLPYCDGIFKDTEIADAKKNAKEALKSGGDRVLLAVKNGTYEVIQELLGPEGYQDEYGRYVSRIRIRPRT